MRIPDYTRKPRWYVALNNLHALSSWDTLEKAQDSVARLDLHCPEVGNELIAIIRVDKNGRVKFPLER